MKYSHNYTKLTKPKYTTIRRYKKAKVGDIISENYPGGSHIARVVLEKRTTLDDVNLKTLLNDCDCDTRKDAYNLFQSFYKKKIDFEKERFYFYLMERIDLDGSFK